MIKKKFTKIFKIELSSYIYSTFFGYLILLALLSLFKLNYLIKNVPNPISDIPNFEFYNNHGESITKNSLINKIIILNFIFTRCEGTCPIMSDFMGELYAQYKNNSDILLLSITVDPAFDTIEILKQYAEANGVYDDRWYFLTGEMETIKDFGKKGFYMISDYFPSTHTKKIYLIDKKGRYRKFYDGTDKKSIYNLKNHIKILLKEI